MNEKAVSTVHSTPRSALFLKSRFTWHVLMKCLTKAHYYYVNNTTLYELHTSTSSTLLLSVDTHNQYGHAWKAEDIDGAMIGEIQFLGKC